METQRLLLREMNPEDFEALFRVLGDPVIMQHYPYAFDEQCVRSWIGDGVVVPSHRAASPLVQRDLIRQPFGLPPSPRGKTFGGITVRACGRRECLLVGALFGDLQPRCVF